MRELRLMNATNSRMSGQKFFSLADAMATSSSHSSALNHIKCFQIPTYQPLFWYDIRLFSLTQIPTHWFNIQCLGMIILMCSVRLAISCSSNF